MQLGWWEEPDWFVDERGATQGGAHRPGGRRSRPTSTQLFDGLTQKSTWRYHSFGPATIMETPGYVGDDLPDVAVPGVDGLFMIGERTREAKVMGVYGSAQVALAAHQRINDVLAQRRVATTEPVGQG